MSSIILTFVIGANPPARLDKALVRDAPEDAHLSRTRLSRLLAAGCVQVNGSVIRNARLKVAEGAQITLRLDDAREADVDAEALPLDVVYEDGDLIVVNKPAGMVVHPASGNPSGTLVNALLAYCGDSLSGVGGVKRPGIVHRIDKDTSGLLVVAKTDRAHHGLAAQFAAHTAMRVYIALVHGVPDAGDPRLAGLRGVQFEPGNVLKLTTGIARHRTDRQRQAVVFAAGRLAITRAKVTEQFSTALALMRCWLETGRTHQIRVHMGYAGHGLVGDPIYGGHRRLKKNALPHEMAKAVAAFPRQALHAACLKIEHPVTGALLSFTAPLPQDMQTLLACLRSS